MPELALPGPDALDDVVFVPAEVPDEAVAAPPDPLALLPPEPQAASAPQSTDAMTEAMSAR